MGTMIYMVVMVTVVTLTTARGMENRMLVEKVKVHHMHLQDTVVTGFQDMVV